MTYLGRQVVVIAKYIAVGQNLVEVGSRSVVASFCTTTTERLSVTDERSVEYCLATVREIITVVCCKLEILQEGKIRKMVRQVAQLSFNGPMARKKGQEVMVVTERAVFQLVKDGVELIEIARESIYRHRYLIKWILSQL